MPPNPDLGSSEPHESHDNIIGESRNLRNQLKNQWTNLDQQANEIFWREEVVMDILMKVKKKWGLCGEDEEVPEGFNCDNNLFDISKFNSTSNSKADPNAKANSNATADSNCNSNDSSSKNNQEEGDKNEDIDNDEDADANAASTSKSNTNLDDSSPKDNQNADAASSSPSASASNLDDTELWSLISQLIKRAINHQPGDIFEEEYIRVLMLNIAIECARLYGAPGTLEGSDDSDSDFDSDDSDDSDSEDDSEDDDNGDEDEDDDEGDDENENEDGTRKISRWPRKMPTTTVTID
ncbi:hypothetical protein FPQ18DRAFT_421085 [Pyronema domesticum]|nr:hypothetical protein FPQ18DRAFT_421085 [Pyronema domesticum]